MRFRDRVMKALEQEAVVQHQLLGALAHLAVIGDLRVVLVKGWSIVPSSRAFPAITRRISARSWGGPP